jgi:hypothetical protein
MMAPVMCFGPRKTTYNGLLILMTAAKSIRLQEN